MTYPEIIPLLLEGKLVRRTSWPGIEHLRIMEHETYKGTYHLLFRCRSHNHVNSYQKSPESWTHKEDLEATDWEELKESLNV